MIELFYIHKFRRIKDGYPLNRVTIIKYDNNYKNFYSRITDNIKSSLAKKENKKNNCFILKRQESNEI